MQLFPLDHLTETGWKNNVRPANLIPIFNSPMLCYLTQVRYSKQWHSINNAFESTTTKAYGMQCTLYIELELISMWFGAMFPFTRCLPSLSVIGSSCITSGHLQILHVTDIFLHNSCMPVIPLIILTENYPGHLLSQRQKFLPTTIICSHRWSCMAHKHLFMLMMLVLLHWFNNSLISVSNKNIKMIEMNNYWIRIV